ncbi:MAG: 3-hydroxyacyl-[acyl-carrier-protein] dehydratase [Phycisphaerales bacterium]|jgi:3-hydroxyacyl-[acyl-carrier-protein] dehydratase
MHFDLVDRVLEREPDRIVTIKTVSNAEEYLRDHFPSFPVLPGVLMLESMVQAAREHLDPQNTAEMPWVLGSVRALKYGRFVKPGDRLQIEAVVHKRNEDGSVEYKGKAEVFEPGASEPAGTACSGRMLLRPAILSAPGAS